MMRSEAIMNPDSTPHASPGNGEADHAGSCFSCPKIPLDSNALARHLADKGLVLPEGGVNQLGHLFDQQGYYRLRGYWLTLEKDGRFLPNTSIDDILKIERFDRELSFFVFQLITPIELKLRAQLSREMSAAYGTQALHDSQAFKDADDFERLQCALERETKQAVASKKPFVLHNLAEYGQLPIWAEVENASLGTLSKTYENLSDTRLATHIARSFGVPRSHLKNWLRYLNQIRNVCAHHDRLYNKLFSIRPRLFTEHAGLDTARVFPVFIVLFKLLESIDPQEAHDARLELDALVRKHVDVDLVPCGFPENWRDIVGINVLLEPGTGRPRGRKGGRPAKNAAALEKALYLYDRREATVAEIKRLTGVSSSTLYKYLTQRKAAAANGSSVEYVIEQLPS